jgi:uncharacterized protein YebE (UPF0316 family)
VKIEFKHVVGGIVILVLTAVFKDELTKGLRNIGWA